MRRKGFEGLMEKAMGRFQKFSKATQAKYMEAMKADEENPAMYREMKAEFEGVWKESDADADGLLNLDEFKVFMNKYYEANKKRFGEAAKNGEKEDEMWFRAYNSLTSGVNGVSMEDFKKGREIVRGIMRKMGNMMTFAPLA